MLINELPVTKKQELARKLRKLIEPDKAQTSSIIKESEIRKFLSQDKLTYYGISDLISILKTNYSDKTISRLVSRIQKSIVWDTCLCHLSSQEITDLLFNSPYGNLITRTVYDELLKLALSKSAEPGSADNALRLVTNILDDTTSKYCSIIDLPPKILNQTYVDNQLLIYCATNNYPLYTHDYVLGLRAKSRNIQAKIFSDFDKSSIEQYEPNPSGKNMILDYSLLNKVSIFDILTTAKSINGNKFLLTRKFIENLELSNVKMHNKDLINFFVLDQDDNYTSYLPEKNTTDLAELAEKYDAVIFSADIEQCIVYRNFFIPYKIVYPKEMVAFKRNILNTLKSSPYSYNINVSDLTIENESDKNSDKPKNNEQNTSVRQVLQTPPHYMVQTHQISLSKLALTERMWILNETGTDITSESISKISLHVGYTIIHIKKIDPIIYGLNVYKVVNTNAKCCMNIVSLTFSKNTLDTLVPAEYQLYARVTVRLT